MYYSTRLFLKTPIAITGIASLSALGETKAAHELAYNNDQSAIVWDKTLSAFTAPLTQKAKQEIDKLNKRINEFNLQLLFRGNGGMSKRFHHG